MALTEQQGRAMLGLLPEATGTPFSDEEGLSLVDQWYEDLSGMVPDPPGDGATLSSWHRQRAFARRRMRR